MQCTSGGGDPEYAFSRCSVLAEVTIPTSVKFIGGCAFKWCSVLAEVMIPTPVKFIEIHAFWDAVRY